LKASHTEINDLSTEGGLKKTKQMTTHQNMMTKHVNEWQRQVSGDGEMSGKREKEEERERGRERELFDPRVKA
jgi:hypothetical protein